MDSISYKKAHPPKPIVEGETGKPHQGIYVPKHPEKVIGGDIVYRSGWELAFARWCDDNDAVVEWGGEPTAIQYRNPSDVDFDACRKANVNPMDPCNWPILNYYPDFYIALKVPGGSDENVKRLLVEIKPKHQTERPVPPAQNAKLADQKRFVSATKIYLTNKAKWQAAIEWCKPRGFEFKVYTEVTLKAIGII